VTNKYYQQFSNIFAHSSVPWQQEILKQFLNKAEVTDSYLIADIGSGVGNNIQTILGFTRQITAIDISPGALSMLKKRYAGIDSLSIIQADATKLPFRAETFDAVILTEILEHCENPAKALSESLRILKKGGHIIMSTPNYFNPAGLWKKICDLVNPASTWDAWGNHEKGVENFFTSFKLSNLAKSQDIKIVTELGGDIIRSWLPFFRKQYRFIDRHPFLRVGKMWPIKYLLMNYFILGKKDDIN